ncbi:hypothetical protein [Pseudomonas fluorescens]|uniref:hypothetical protein n=1 Tax=Pseudomonas fluorescens TaxID=294 RepID=UPI001240F103|nr:hypothetical protein [Pseudomonas fluorescens]
MIIAPQSLSWQPLIEDLQGDFTARLNAKLIVHHSDLLNIRRDMTTLRQWQGARYKRLKDFIAHSRARRMEPKQ